MKNFRLITAVIATSTIGILNLQNASAQASIPIDEGFACLSDLDGPKSLGRLEQREAVARCEQFKQ